MKDQDGLDGTVRPGAKILVIDDEEVIHVSLKRLLGRQGHTIDAVLSAQEGLDRLDSGDYDMIITDLMMPEMNGIELLEKLEEMNLSLPVLMITGYPTIKTAMQAMRLGATDYLAKPFRRQELLGPVNRMLRRGPRAEGAPIGPALQEENETDPQTEAPQVGECYVLRGHAWARFQQDGTVQIGLEKSFLDSVGSLDNVLAPGEAELIEQGYVGIRLVTSGGEEHGVFMPLSGQVVAVNEQSLGTPVAVSHEAWLIQVIPSHFDSERAYLHRC